MADDEAVQRAHDARAQRPLDVAEEDYAGLVGEVLEAVDVGLVEDEVLAVAPRILVAVDEDATFVAVRRDESQVVADRARERIAVLADFAARPDEREHRPVDGRDRLDERDRLRAERARRRQRRAVPLQVEPLPSLAEEAVEPEVVVLVGGADVAGVVEPHRLVANRPPVGA